MPVEKLNKEVIKSQLSWIWIVTQQKSSKIIQWLVILGYSRILERRCRQNDCLIITGVLKGVRLTALNTSNDKRTDRRLYEGIHLQSENVTQSWSENYVARVYSWRIPRLLRTWHQMWWCLKWPTSPLFTQVLVQAQIKENIKAPRHWPLRGEFTGDRWIPRTKGQ